MKIKFLAADSLGVRSMATLVETPDTLILIDPAAALGPRRYGLPPHKLELEALESAWQEISEFSEDAEIVVVTHYHYDHHSRKRNLEIYKDKILMIKDPNSFINDSQRWRARAFLKKIEGLPKQIIVVDSKEFFVGDTQIVFSKPVPHGEPNTKLGYVLEVYISDGDDSFLFSSDVEGLLDNSQAEFIVEMKPNIIYLDGLPTYLGERKALKFIDLSLQNIDKVIRAVKPGILIMDHHLLRDLRYREYFGSLGNFITAAEFMGRPLNLLEARRKELWGKE